MEGPAEVEDVLGEGEATGDERRVDDPVDRAADVAPAPEEQGQQAQALGELLDHGGLDHCAQELGGDRLRFGGTDPGGEEAAEEQGEAHGSRGSPDEGVDQGDARLRGVSVQPPDGQQHDGDRHQGRGKSHQGGAHAHRPDHEDVQERRHDDQAQDRQAPQDALQPDTATAHRLQVSTAEATGSTRVHPLHVVAVAAVAGVVPRDVVPLAHGPGFSPRRQWAAGARGCGHAAHRCVPLPRAFVTAPARAL